MLNDSTYHKSTESKFYNVNLASIFLSLSVFLFLFLILFLPGYTRYWGLGLLTADMIYIMYKRETFKERVYLDETPMIFMWLLFIVISFGGLVFSTNNLFSGLKFTFTLSLFLFNLVLLVLDKAWVNLAIKSFLGITIFFLLGSFLQIISPDTLLAINKLHLTETLFEQSLEFYNNGNLNGFTHQTLVNGFLISMLMGIVFSYIYRVKSLSSKIWLWITYLGLYYMLLMTDRRGLILFTAMIIFFLIFRLSNRKQIAILVVVSIAIVFLMLLIGTQPGRDLIDRTFRQADFTTGRLAMIEIMWSDFLESPLLGNGTYTTIDVVHFYHGHNIYFQVLRENGIFGLLLLLSILVYNFVKTNLRLIQFNDNSLEQQVLILTLYYQMLFILSGFTENVLYDTYALYVYILAVAMSMSIGTLNSQKTLIID